jgi:hypothetical protein
MPLKITATTKFEARTDYPAIRTALLVLVQTLEGYNSDGPYPNYPAQLTASAPILEGGKAQIDFTTNMSELEVTQKSTNWLKDSNNQIKAQPV